MKWELDGATCLRALPESGDTEAVFPAQVRRVAPGALSGLAQLRRIVLNDGVKTLPVGFAYGCASLTEVRWPKGLKEIRANAFGGCASLQKIELPESVEALGEGAFAGCHPNADIVLLGPYTNRVRQSRALPRLARLRALCAPQADFLTASDEEKLALACGYCLHPEHAGRYAPKNAEAIQRYLTDELPRHFGELCEKNIVYEMLLACAGRGLIRDPEALRSFLTYARTLPTDGERKRRLAQLEAQLGPASQTGERDKRLLRRLRPLMGGMDGVLRREGVAALPAVRWRDGETPAPAEALTFVLCAYMNEWPALNAHPRALKRLAEADEVAALLSPDDLSAACASLRCPEAPGDGGRTEVRFPRRLLPCLRFADDQGVWQALSDIDRWQDYARYGQEGRIAAEAAERAVLLSDSREALVYAARCGRLAEYAAQRGVDGESEEALMARFSLDEDEVFSFDTGREAFFAEVQPDGGLSFRREDEGAENVGLGMDAPRARACAVSLRRLEERTREVFEETRLRACKGLVTGDALPYEAWRQTYLSRRAARAAAQGVLFERTLNGERAYFLLRDGEAVLSNGTALALSGDAQYAVAHPMEMSEEELARWRAHPVLESQLLLPLLPVKVEEKRTYEGRYDGLVVPMRLLTALAPEAVSLRRMSSGVVQLLFFGHYAMGLTAHAPDGEELGPDTPMTLGSLGGAALSPRALVCLTALLDRALIEAMIADGRVEAAPYLTYIAPERMDGLLERCIEAGHTASVAALIDWRSAHADASADPLSLGW